MLGGKGNLQIFGNIGSGNHQTSRDKKKKIKKNIREGEKTWKQTPLKKTHQRVIPVLRENLVMTKKVKS